MSPLESLQSRLITSVLSKLVFIFLFISFSFCCCLRFVLFHVSLMYHSEYTCKVQWPYWLFRERRFNAGNFVHRGAGGPAWPTSLSLRQKQLKEQMGLFWPRHHSRGWWNGCSRSGWIFLAQLKLSQHALQTLIEAVSQVISKCSQVDNLD